MEIIEYSTLERIQEVLKRPNQDTRQASQIAKQVLDEVKMYGEEAVIRYTHFFDRVDIADFVVTKEEIEKAKNAVSNELKEAIELAYQNISLFHQAQQVEREIIETTKGVKCWQKNIPISRVGIYIPGGTAPLFSTVLMLGVPAQLAGCKEVVICTPPNEQGEIDDTILYTASRCGIEKIFKVGGVQAIGALAYGTKSIPKVDKIFGPGNSFVMAAKQLVQQDGVPIDLPAGPSELMVVADNSIPPAWVAADLIAQAEHGEDSQVVLLSIDRNFLRQTKEELEKQLNDLPRKEVTERALNNGSFILLNSWEQAVTIVNDYAPEHLLVATKDSRSLVDKVENAGSVFIGKYSPESAGDYATGTNHTLPTNGFAKAYSSVGVASFQKVISYQELDVNGLELLSDAIQLMAKAEGLEGHARSIAIRFGKRTRKRELSKTVRYEMD